ncbi:ABC-2 family transporter protein [Candidatus Daviesbacteria bacterium]|nr:ABC-2 family transporter protein [Candidatus Daviesbacteria bacterium]
MKKYLRVWWVFAINSFQTQMMVRWAMGVFLFGKLLRFAIFSFFIWVLLSRTQALAGYSLTQTFFFYLSFNLIDVIAQLLFREVYRFRPAVVNGTFDFYLIKPYNALFRALTSGPDLLDIITLIPLLGAIAYFIGVLQINFFNVLIFVLLALAGFLIATAFHILVLALAVATTEIDHAIMLYRDVTNLGRFPIDIYKEPLRGFLTFIIPVGLMMSFPAKSLMGFLSPLLVIYTLIFSLVFLYLSILIWKLSLKHYSSASS